MPTNGWNLQAKPGKMLPPVWGASKEVPVGNLLPVTMTVTKVAVVIDKQALRMALPVGNKTGQNCGVTAVAIAAGVGFNHAWTVVAQVRRDRGYSAGKTWNGSCSVNDRNLALDIFGVKRRQVVPVRQTLMGWIKREAKPGVRYMVRTKQHVQMVLDGVVCDQNSIGPVSKYWGRRKFVTHITVLED